MTALLTQEQVDAIFALRDAMLAVQLSDAALAAVRGGVPEFDRDDFEARR